MTTPTEAQTLAQQPTAQVIVTPLGVVTAMPPPPPIDTEVAEARAAAAREVLATETQGPPDRGRHLEIAQGLYYLILGLWPVVSASSYQAVTEMRTDLWHMRTLGLVIAVIGVSLLLAARRRSVALESLVVAAGVAAVLGITDLINVSVKALTPLYAFDAIFQAAFVYGWVRALNSTTDAVHLLRR